MSNTRDASRDFQTSSRIFPLQKTVSNNPMHTALSLHNILNMNTRMKNKACDFFFVLKKPHSSSKVYGRPLIIECLISKEEREGGKEQTFRLKWVWMI